MKIIAQKDRNLQWIIALVCSLSLLIGLFVLFGWFFNIDLLTRWSSEFIPMAPVTAIISVFFCLAFLGNWYYPAVKSLKTAILIVIGLISVYSLLLLLEYLFSFRLTLDDILFPVTSYFGIFPIKRASPITGTLFFLLGIGLMISMIGNNRLLRYNLVSLLGVIIMFCGFAGFLGYILQTPLFYGGNIIPVALPTTIVFLFLGIALIILDGEDGFVLRSVSGNRPSARLLRLLLPVIVLAMLADDLLLLAFARVTTLNHAIVSTAATLFFIPITVLIVVRVSKVIFQKAEKAEVEKKQAVEALVDSEEKYRLLVENQGEGVALVDPDEFFIFANPAAEGIFGVVPGGLTGRNLRDFLNPEQLSAVLEETRKRANVEKSTYEIEIINAHNQVKHLLITATPQMDAEGKLAGTFGVFRDISERKKIEAEREQYSKALQESNITKDKFFSIIAHDLKNPFNSILGLTDVLIAEWPTLAPADIEKILGTIKKSSSTAFELLQNLLEWANSQTGKIEYRPEYLPLCHTLKNSITEVAAQASAKNISIEVDCEDNSYATFDKQMMHTILRNLISNAVKFTQAGGTVNVVLTKSKDFFIISVKDKGMGIPEENLPKLFRIEGKYSTKGTANEKGTGLGLILCKEFVEKQGGRIWVESEEGQGSTFSFSLPA